MLLTPAQMKPKSFQSTRNFFFLPGVDASHVYVRAWALGCFHSQVIKIWQSLEEGAGKRCSEFDQYPNLSEGADRVGGQLRGDKLRVPLQLRN